MSNRQRIPNFIGGAWRAPEGGDYLPVFNPATGEALAEVPLTGAAEVDRAVEAAQEAFPEWRRTPVTERVQYLFRLKQLLEEHFDEIARGITLECGKTLEESKGELRRGIENVEVACGAPAMMQGYNSEDIARGIDETMIRQPLGVAAAVTPFNFPGMIPLWFLPYAVAFGNCIIVKPSERVPMTMQRIVSLIEAVQLPAGVVQLLNGDKPIVDAILDHPGVRAVSFVGSSPVAHYVYSRAASRGKRVQCQGGARNPIVILPDAEMEAAGRIVADSAFGCAGQRCLAGSLALTVGRARETFGEVIAGLARDRTVGFGLSEGVQMGPVISPQSKSRIESLIDKGTAEGARVQVDGRGVKVPGYNGGNFLGPTILQDVPPEGELAVTEVFGPVLSLVHCDRLDQAIEQINRGRYGNMACLFTSSGAAARKFRYEVEAGNIGINLGVAAPMAFFPFSGWKDSFFGDLHGQGWDAVEFYTEKKVVVERWPREWSRKF